MTLTIDLAQLPRTRAEALALGEKYYFTGEPCKYGHVTYRKAAGDCYRCYKERMGKDKEGKSRWYQNNKEKHRQLMKDWNDANRDERRTWMRRYEQSKRRLSPAVAIAERLRAKIGEVLRGKSKSASTMELTGCTIEQLMAHLESQFTDGMTWENRGQWHVDHIMPCASFDLTDPEQQRACFHFTNLQPLWAGENLSKGARIMEPQT